MRATSLNIGRTLTPSYETTDLALPMAYFSTHLMTLVH